MRKGLASKLLRELLRNSKRSDRELAKVLDVSQPTITRARQKLVNEEMIRDYTFIPDFRKMGFEIMALTFVKMRPGLLSEDTVEKGRQYVAAQPNAIFMATGEGLGMNGVIISFHRSYTEYHRQLLEARNHWKDTVEAIDSFIVAIGEGEFKRFSLSYLADVPIRGG